MEEFQNIGEELLEAPKQPPTQPKPPHQPQQQHPQSCPKPQTSQGILVPRRTRSQENENDPHRTAECPLPSLTPEESKTRDNNSSHHDPFERSHEIWNRKMG